MPRIYVCVYANPYFVLFGKFSSSNCIESSLLIKLAYCYVLDDQGAEFAQSAAVFFGKCVPPISLEDYIVRMHKYGHCSPAAFLYAVVYMDRLVDKYGPTLAPNRFNVHRLLLAGVMEASYDMYK
eukprot:scaffold164612_cov30-Prasinocladus_malaysianus.AAC.1